MVEMRRKAISKNIITLYLAILSVFIAFTSMLAYDLQANAFRADLKVMTLELKGPSAITARMGTLRNEIRRRAMAMQWAVLSLVIAIALASISTLSTESYWIQRFLFIASIAMVFNSLIFGMRAYLSATDIQLIAERIL